MLLLHAWHGERTKTKDRAGHLSQLEKRGETDDAPLGALALLLGATGATLATIAVVFQLADDGGALVAEAGRPSARVPPDETQTPDAPGRGTAGSGAPAARGPGLVLLGAGAAAAPRAAGRTPLAQTQIDGGDAHADPEWDFRRGPAGGPAGGWREGRPRPARPPFFNGDGARGLRSVVVHARDPMDCRGGVAPPRLLRSRRPPPRRTPRRSGWSRRSASAPGAPSGWRRRRPVLRHASSRLRRPIGERRGV